LSGPPQRRRRLALFALLFGSVVGLGVLEVGLRALTKHPYAAKPARRRDDALVYRMNPAYPEIDVAGFRNDRVPHSAEVVALGDSHTYGYNVPARDSWPQQLARETGQSVYNMGVGGYGLVQYRVLFGRALALAPRRIVVGLYLVNDLADVCNSIHASRGSAAWAREQGLWPSRCGPARRNPVAERALLPGSVLERAALGSAMSTVIVRPAWRAYQEWLESGSLSADSARVESGPQRTYIVSRRIESHAASLNLGGRRIEFGWAFANALLREMAARSRAAGVRLQVLLIPSKEWVVHALVRSHGGKVSDAYEQLVRSETARVADVQTLCAALSIGCVSALDELRAALSKPVAVYPASGDGHPLASGYAAYVRALHRLPR
jgi:hypothetical protein